MPLTGPQKVGVVFYGFAIGACAVLAATVAAVILAFLMSALLSVAHLGGHDAGGGFFVLEAAFLGFYAGIVVGMIVCWRVWRSRFSRIPTE